MYYVIYLLNEVIRWQMSNNNVLTNSVDMIINGRVHNNDMPRVSQPSCTRLGISLRMGRNCFVLDCITHFDEYSKYLPTPSHLVTSFHHSLGKEEISESSRSSSSLPYRNMFIWKIVSLMHGDYTITLPV